MSPRTPGAPPRLDGFEYLSLLGSGGFADVFRYRQTTLDREVAVKVLANGLPGQAQELFRAEAKVMAKLSSHAAIVTIYQAGVADDGRPYLVMEVCRPHHLGARLRHRPLDVARALQYGIEIAGAVETAHRLGVLHRDIKPANILINESGRPALTDFGISVSSYQQQAAAAFSPSWAPPEQLDNRPMGPSGDVYSLAATVWAMLAGRSPFELPQGPNDTASISERVRKAAVPLTGALGVPESLERVLRTALAKDPSQRYASALEFARALQGVQAELRQSVTTIDVRDEHAFDEDMTAYSDTGTRVTGFVEIDPDGPGTRTASAWQDVSGLPTHPTGGGVTGRGTSGASGVLQHGVGSLPATDPRDFTGPAIPTPEPPAGGGEHARPDADPATGGERPAHQAGRLGLVAVIVALVAVIGVGAVWALGRTPATTNDVVPTRTARPADPLGPVVPQPKELTLAPAGDQVTASWTNPDPRPGDTFLFRVPQVGVEVPYDRTEATTVTVDAQPGRTCLDVILRRADGRSSSPLTTCTP